MKHQSSVQQVLRCGLGVTDNARKGITKFAKDEHAFFAMQEAFDLHIEKRPKNKHGKMSFTFFFDQDTNGPLAKRVEGRVAVMDCVYQHDGFLATGFHVRGRKELVRTNRRLPVRLKFDLRRNSGVEMPIELYTSLRELPIAEERSEYVKKRISSWEGYLGIQERNADVADVTAVFSRASFNEDFSKLRLVCTGLKGQDWQSIKGFSAKVKGAAYDIGNVVNVNRSKSVVEIELNRNLRERARKKEWRPKSNDEVVFSNFAELSQVRRLRKGFKDLQDGLAANPNLEKVLFEERPTVRISKNNKKLVFHNTLNEYQREAVTGAMTANDLYVIQGPPGTGKTTVISEICHQNVKAGLRTLVASQANLAVDNALGRLLSHQDIRILRYGRTESIEEEGKKFIEENVALNWKEQTLAAVTEQLQSHVEKEAQLEDDLNRCSRQIADLQQELDSLDKKIEMKQEAQADYQLHSKALETLTNRMESKTAKRDELVKRLAKLEQSADDAANDILSLEQFLQTESISPETIEQMQIVERQIGKLRSSIGYRYTLQQIGEAVNMLAATQQQVELTRSKLNDLHKCLQGIQSITKLDVLEKHIHDFGLVPSLPIDRKMNELRRLITEVKSSMSNGNYSEWNKLNDRLSTAIENIEELLRKNGFLKQTLKRSVNQKYTSVSDIHGLIDRVGRFLIDPLTKHLLETRSYSAQKYDTLEKIADALELLRERKHYVQAQAAKFQQQQQLLQQTKTIYVVIKEEIIGEVQQTIAMIEQERDALQQDSEGKQIELSDLRQASSKLLQQLGTVDESASIGTMEEELDSKEKIWATYEEKKKSLEQYAQQLEAKKNEAEVTSKQLEDDSTLFQVITQEIEELRTELDEQEKLLAELKEILKQNPEKERQQALTTFNDLSQKEKWLNNEKVRLPITHALQQEWFTLLTDANDYDLDEIRKLYVRHANVIGTTCVASARRDFMDEYPTFDVVIIDEVSKATPPELLLPMLKGKKIILVGDHHQLPPLIGQETLEEFLEEIDNREEKKEFEKLLNESLFERLFRTLPKQNKTMLGIQYRMHEDIMQTITPFYSEGNYRLQCGLTDSDAVRDHLLDSRYVQRKDHLLWFDMPNKPDYFEEKMKGGTSRFNQAELTMVENLLMDLDSATAKAKTEGRMGQEDKKSVGVISFYGEQVKRIDRLIQQELNPQHLHCRTGSVDKFQGMEMDVILLSFVRNHKEKGGDIGFAKDYRRLNVALSRARELLIIVGSSEMFTIRTKHPSSREMYGRLLMDIKKKNGFRDHEGHVLT